MFAVRVKCRETPVIVCSLVFKVDVILLKKRMEKKSEEEQVMGTTGHDFPGHSQHLYTFMPIPFAKNFILNHF